MADIFVKAGGDGSHGAGYDPTSDSWASAHDSLNDSESHYSQGDVIKVSHLHNKNYTTSQTLRFGGDLTNQTTIISVDDTSPSTYRPGAKETGTAGTVEIAIDNLGAGDATFYYGITFQTGKVLSFTPGSTGSVWMFDCVLSQADTAAAGDIMQCAIDGSQVLWHNCEMSYSGDATTNAMNMKGGSTFIWIGGFISAPGSEPDPQRFLNAPGLAGGKVEVYSVDFSGGDSTFELHSTGNNTTHDLVPLFMTNCLLPSGWIINAVTAPNKTMAPIEIFNSQTGGEVRAGFAREDERGEVVSLEGSSSAGIHRTDGTAIDTGTYLTAQVDSRSFVNKFFPFKFRLASKYEDDYSTNGSVRVYLACTSALTDADVWIECYYTDSTNSGQTNRADSGAKSNSVRSPLLTGTTLTSDTGSTWMNGGSALSGYNEYYVDCTLTNGADGLVDVYFYCGVASETIYIDTEIDFV